MKSQNRNSQFILHKMLPGAAVFCMLFSASAFADTLELKNGKSFQVKVVSQTLDSIAYVADGKTVRIKKNEIRRIKYDMVKVDAEAVKVSGKSASKAEIAKAKARQQEMVRQEEERRKLVENISNELEEILKEEQKLKDQEEELLKKKEEVAKRKREARVKQGLAALDDEEIAALKAENKKLPTIEESKEYVWRSSVLPGWGQFRQKRYWQGSLIAFSVFSAAGLYAASANSSRSAQDSYESKLDQNLLLIPRTNIMDLLAFMNYMEIQNSRADMKRSSSQAIAATSVAGLIYLYNILDSFYFSKKRHKIPEMNQTGYLQSGFLIGAASENDADGKRHMMIQSGYRFLF